jgi:hypothetical protein
MVPMRLTVAARITIASLRKDSPLRFPLAKARFSYRTCIAAASVNTAPPTYTTFDHVNHEDAESKGTTITMDIFLLGAIGFVAVSLAVYIAASLRLEHSRRMQNKPPDVGSTHNETR